MILKLMHVINHMEAAELKFQMPISEAALFDRAEKRILKFADQMRSEGHQLVAFYGSRKTRTSLITKLLAKRETIAATVFDKLRFRIITEEPEQILPVLAYLARHLFPFNYVIPGQSHNNLVHLRRAIRDTPHYATLASQMQRLRTHPTDWLPDKNPFSGNSYRMVNFISDFPVRVDEIRPEMDAQDTYLLGKVVFVLVESQIVDRKTSEKNEIGDNAHELYKARQRRIVESRLPAGACLGSTPRNPSRARPKNQKARLGGEVQVGPKGVTAAFIAVARPVVGGCFTADHLPKQGAVLRLGFPRETRKRLERAVVREEFLNG